MSGIKNVDFKSDKAADDLVESFRNTGFAVIRNHPISQELIDETYREWRAFFENLTEKERLEYKFDEVNQAGYFPFGSEKAKDSNVTDLKSFFHYYPWYNKVPTQIRTTPILFDKLSGVAAQLLNWIEMKTPAEIAQNFSMPLSQMLTGSRRTLFRVIYYPPLKGDETPGAVRAAEHEDINLITLLPAATANGLEVKDVNGKWHSVNCEDKNSLVINVGDMLQMASKGYYPSTTHRVVNPIGAERGQPRYSMPLFLHPEDKVRLSPSHTAESYLMERLKELGLVKKN